MFKLYSCKLRLDGSVLNEIRKFDVTVPEIEVLKILHGSDSVVDIKETGEVKRSDRDERARIEAIFASPANAMGESLAKKKRMLTDLFGHERMALPKEIEEVAAPADEDEVDEGNGGIVAAPAPKAKKERAPAFAE